MTCDLCVPFHELVEMGSVRKREDACVIHAERWRTHWVHAVMSMIRFGRCVVNFPLASRTSSALNNAHPIFRHVASTPFAVLPDPRAFWCLRISFQRCSTTLRQRSTSAFKLLTVARTSMLVRTAVSATCMIRARESSSWMRN